MVQRSKIAQDMSEQSQKHQNKNTQGSRHKKLEQGKNPKHEKNLEDNLGGTTEKPPTADKEYGGQNGPEPTRYGDWEKNGIISDF